MRRKKVIQEGCVINRQSGQFLFSYELIIVVFVERVEDNAKKLFYDELSWLY